MVSLSIAESPGEMVRGVWWDTEEVIPPCLVGGFSGFQDLNTFRVAYLSVHVETDSRIGLVVSPAHEVIFPCVSRVCGEFPNSVTVVSSGDTGRAPSEVLRP